MKTLRETLTSAYRETEVGMRHSILGMIFCLSAVCVCLLLSACASSKPGLARENAIYAAGTNVVAQVHSLLPYVPAPLATPVELLLGIASAALGAWNLHQQGALKKLRNAGVPHHRHDVGSAVVLHVEVESAVREGGDEPRRFVRPLAGIIVGSRWLS
jgi:hypothetical protein